MARRWQNVAALTVACALTVAPGFGIRPARAQVATILPAGTPSLNGLTRYQIDADDSSLEFRVAFMGVSTVHGNFTSYEGTMMYDPQHVNRTSITLAILTESINTAVPARDRDLRSPNFFDAKKYPVIMFTSTAVKASRYANSMDVIGNLTMHGTTRPIVLALYNQHRLVKDAWQNRRIGFFGAAGVNRKDFGIDGIAFWNNEFDPGRRAISDKVEINFEIEAELVNMDTRDFPKAQALIARIDGEGLTAVAASLKRAAPDAKSDAYPAFRSMLVNAAAKLRQRGRFADGAGLYTVLTDLDGKDAEAFAGLGELEFFLGERQRAVADFKRAVEADPTSTMALEYLRHLPQ